MRAWHRVDDNCSHPSHRTQAQNTCHQGSRNALSHTSRARAHLKRRLASLQRANSPPAHSWQPTTSTHPLAASPTMYTCSGIVANTAQFACAPRPGCQHPRATRKVTSAICGAALNLPDPANAKQANKALCLPANINVSTRQKSLSMKISK